MTDGYQRFPLRLTEASAPATGAIIYTGSPLDTLAIFTCFDIIPDAGTNGTSRAVLYITATGAEFSLTYYTVGALPDESQLHGAHWRGLLPVSWGDTLSFASYGPGVWDIVGSGFYVPAYQ